MKNTSGFTLIELSIVLVIIGLIVGGILTGRDLISGAAQRAQISQIEKYNTAVHTFQNKYGYLPGDIPDPQASSFGFIARGTLTGQGDGDGILEGYGNTGNGNSCGYLEGRGEATVFWIDLSIAGLIDGSFNTASETAAPPHAITPGSSPTLSAYFPSAKLGNGNYVYATGGGLGSNGAPCKRGDGFNYFNVSLVTQFDTGGRTYTDTGITVLQASNIDKKADDGLPQSGNVTATYNNWNVPYNGSIGWAAGSGNFGADAGAPNHGATTAATPYATTNCYDNNNTAGVQQTYSISQNANTLNCALSFRFQ